MSVDAVRGGEALDRSSAQSSNRVPDPDSEAHGTNSAADDAPTDERDASAKGEERSGDSPVVRTALGALRAMLADTAPSDAADPDESS
jgi:hypothetical protein